MKFRSLVIKKRFANIPQKGIFKAINVFGTSKKKLTFYFVFVITQLNSLTAGGECG